MREQTNAAAERSAHVTRAGAEYVERCVVCGGPWRKGGASYAARAGLMPGVPIMEVCSAACAAQKPFARDA